MSVIVKGMEMPKDCGHCRFAVDGWCYAYGGVNIDALYAYERANYCPLVPVPPHGRLIDADALTAELGEQRRVYQLLDDTHTADLIMHGIYRAEQAVSETLTIVEAEGKE